VKWVRFSYFWCVFWSVASLLTGDFRRSGSSSQWEASSLCQRVLSWFSGIFDNDLRGLSVTCAPVPNIYIGEWKPLRTISLQFHGQSLAIFTPANWNGTKSRTLTTQNLDRLLQQLNALLQHGSLVATRSLLACSHL